MRILRTLSVLLIALSVGPSVVRADTLSVSGVGSNGLFGALTVTGSAPITSNLAYGTFAEDPFTFTPSTSFLDPTFGAISLSGYILADNGVCISGRTQSVAGCVGLFVVVTATDSSFSTDFITLSVDQTFAPAPGTLGPGTILTMPTSSSLGGGCTGAVAGNVSSTTEFPGAATALGALALSTPCSGTNSFSLNAGPSATTFSGDVGYIDISTQLMFSLNSGSIDLPSGSCAGSSCTFPAGLTAPPAVPEPSGLFLLGSGLGGFAGTLLRKLSK